MVLSSLLPEGPLTEVGIELAEETKGLGHPVSPRLCGTLLQREREVDCRCHSSTKPSLHGCAAAGFAFAEIRWQWRVAGLPRLPMLPMIATAPSCQDQNSQLVRKVEELVGFQLSFQPNGIQVHILHVP